MKYTLLSGVAGQVVASRTRGKLKKIKFHFKTRSSVLLLLFTGRIIKQWNKLLREVVNSPLLKALKSD